MGKRLRMTDNAGIEVNFNISSDKDIICDVRIAKTAAEIENAKTATNDNVLYLVRES